jgi:Fic family protein
MEWLVNFANSENSATFIHPIIKAIIIHFFISYLHPFVDGNGRTARALFHWYMLKYGYWLTEYMSISRVIYKSKASYEKAFLRTEADENDMGYFITYHLNALEKAFNELKRYISRKTAQQNDQNRLLRIGDINQRQAEILYMLLKDENMVLTVKDVSSKLLVTPTTAKHDIVGLINKGLLSEISLNRQKKGYIRGSQYQEKVEAVF